MMTQMHAVPRSWAVCLLSILVVVIGGAHAVAPDVWKVSSFNEFAEGEAENVSIVHPGQILLAPSIKAFAEVKDAAVWSMVQAPDGQTLYLGTGNSAKVYKVAVSADSATSEAKLFADLDGNAVYTMLVSGGGDLFAGVSPGGNIYKITPDGAVTLIGTSGQDYIWSMIQDATGDLILATGDKGQLVRMTLEGKTKTICKTGEKHILSLVAGKEGKVYFGTAPNGWVAEVEGNKDFRVLYDSELSEVKSLAVDEQGNLYAGVVPQVQLEAKRDTPQPPQAPTPPKADKSSEIVKISPNGQIRVLDKTSSAAANTLFVRESGLLVGTGDEGKLFQLGFRDRLDLLTDLDVSEILGIIPRTPDGLWLATGNPAKVFLMPVTTSKGGTYASKAEDTQTTNQWGQMTWIASVPEGVTLALQTRSGNSKEPGDTWSEWSEPLTQPGKVLSPAARFLQWRVKFGGSADGKTATLQEVEVVHQPLNRPPLIEKLQVGDQSSASESSSTSQAAKTNGAASKTATTKPAGSDSSSSSSSPSSLPLIWQATDPDGDTLVSELHYRRVSETLWKEIEDDLKASKFTWDVSGLPDGEYEVQLTVSDRLANPPGTAGSDVFQSESVKIDKTAPVVAEWSNQSVNDKSFTVEVRIQDKVSRLKSAEVILDGDEEDLIPIQPEDGIFDSREELFKVLLEDLEAGEHSIAVRSEDEEGNAGSDYLVFTIP